MIINDVTFFDVVVHDDPPVNGITLTFDGPVGLLPKPLMFK